MPATILLLPWLVPLPALVPAGAARSGEPAAGVAPRELSADRPDTTESPITVDAGRFQLEVSLGDWGRERDDDTVTVLQANLKYGLDDATDLQLVLDLWTIQDEGEDGLGDVQVRLKRNLWGNDGQRASALAILPYLEVPTGTRASDGRLAGGLAVPFALPLSEQLDLGLMVQVDVVYDDDEREHSLELLHTAVLGFPIAGDLRGFVEYVGATTTAEDYVMTGNLGLTLQTDPDFMLDCGLRFGLSDEAEDVGAFVGFTYRH